MPSTRVRRALSVAVLACASAAPVAAQETAPDSVARTGGASMPVPPAVARVACGEDEAWRCRPGETVTLRGEALDAVHQVRFVGRRGRADDRVARPRARRADRLEVRVPRTARSGPVQVVAADGRRARTARWLRVVRPRVPARRPAPAADPAPAPAPAPARSGAGVFPVAGPHDFGTTVNGFGGGRGHQGHDVFAACGTPLVAIADATVLMARSHARAGNYVVLQRPDGESHAYMHLQAPTPLRRGQAVRAGQEVGRVGDTGRASGCHLHFEQWTAPGWYQGGRAVDPLPLLRSLDR